MRKEINDGGCVFPSKETTVIGNETFTEHDRGMSLRDYFAAKAMQGLLAETSNGFKLASEIISLSYEIADGMIKAGGE